MTPNDRPAIITVAIPLGGPAGQPPVTDMALREADAIATKAGAILRGRRVTVLDHLEDDDLVRISERAELQPTDTSWLIVTAEVVA